MLLPLTLKFSYIINSLEQDLLTLHSRKFFTANAGSVRLASPELLRVRACVIVRGRDRSSRQLVAKTAHRQTGVTKVLLPAVFSTSIQ